MLSKRQKSLDCPSETKLTMQSSYNDLKLPRNCHESFFGITFGDMQCYLVVNQTSCHGFSRLQKVSKNLANKTIRMKVLEKGLHNCKFYNKRSIVKNSWDNRELCNGCKEKTNHIEKVVSKVIHRSDRLGIVQLLSKFINIMEFITPWYME